MPIFKIHHITKYEYDRPVKESMNNMMVFPFQTPEQETLQHDLHISHDPDLFIYTDYWGNKNGSFNVIRPHQELVIESRLLLRTLAADTLHFPDTDGWQALEQEVSTDLRLLELQRTSAIRQGDAMNQLVRLLKEPGHPIHLTVENTCRLIFEQFTYIKGITTIESTVDEILEKKAGVCQDFAHVMLEILRRMQIPSRYVSGYICPNKNGMRGEGATHAWVEAYLPGYGWAGIDPTNNVWVTNHHVKLAVGRDFTDCSPVKGSFKGPARQSLSVYVSVGYEDGETFEELTRVQLEKQVGPEVPELIIDTFAGQQQQ